jgi:hypothetical protein
LAKEPFVQLAPPLTQAAWSSDFVAQSLETLFVTLREGQADHLRPIHADTLRLGWPPNAQPGDIVLGACDRFDLAPILVHSTSWRHEGDRLILTYVAAVRNPEELSEYLTRDAVSRADLARGEALAPPTDIGVAQVIEHAFRHLAWLVKDDAVVGDALSEWTAFLERFEPEPFRAFGGPPGPQ